MRAIRLLAILDHLRVRRQPISAASLAQELGVSVRTIYRDMDTLREAGAPIHGEGGVGYMLHEGYFLPPLKFDRDELDAIVLGMRLTEAQGDHALASAAKRAASKIRAVLPADERGHYLEAPLLVHSKKKAQAKGPLRYLGRLRVAVRERRRVRISYESLEGEESLRTVCVLGLTVFDMAWVLTAWCEERDGFRNFRADRIKSLRTLDTFPRRPGRELRDYLRTL
ncbi:MAG: helix-turn-helix transcriptional regulator [Nannocystales bacterium]